MQRVTGITYYEELGVPRTARPEEIRDAFRALVRLLHPDQQTDPQLKNIAEAQMRKLNRIYAVLSDPESRRRYDAAMDQAEPAPPPPAFHAPPRDRSRLLARYVWGGAALVIVVVLAWLAWDVPAQPLPQTADRSPALRTAPNVSSADTQAEISRLRSDLKNMKDERDAAVQELARLRGLPVHRSEAAPAPAQDQHTALSAPLTAVTELPVPPPAEIAPRAVAAPPRSSPAPASRGLAGFWFYSAPSAGQHNRNAALYPPDFIEATLTEQSGAIRGRYRSRYQIVDRAISPDVNFEFTGVPNGNTMKSAWTGPGGSRGELRLRLTSENTMEIEWTATELGSVQGLVSGTAKLTRRVE